MSILLLFAAICLLAIAQFCLFLLIIRSVRASIYADLRSFFVPEAEGKPSQFGLVANGMADAMAARLWQSIKSSSIGKIGGQADRKSSPGQPDLLQAIVSRFLPGGLQGVLGGLQDNTPAEGHNGESNFAENINRWG